MVSARRSASLPARAPFGPFRLNLSTRYGAGVWLAEPRRDAARPGPLPMAPGDAVHVPGHWVHRSVNVGDEPFVTLFCYGADAGQDYELIARAGGMASLVVGDDAGGWATRPNPDHVGYST